MGGLLLWSLARLLGLARQLFALRCLRYDAELPPAEVQRHFELLLADAGVKRPVDLLISVESHPPMVAGLGRAAILIPSTLLEPHAWGRLGPILRHEIAHVQRYDDYANLFQQVARCLLPFHPAVAWMGRRLTTEREIACDDHVLHAGQSAREYALLLTEFARESQGRSWSAAPAAWSRKSQLTERVKMILKTNRNLSPRLAPARLGLVTTAALAGVSLLVQLTPQLAFAQIAVPSAAADTVVPAVPAAPAAPAAGADTRVPASGPRSKGGAGSVYIAPSPAPVPALAPVPVIQPEAPVVAGFHPPQLMAARRADDEALERRVERVERMLESLMHQRSDKKPVPPGHPGHPEKSAGQAADAADRKGQSMLAERELADQIAREVAKAKEEAFRQSKDAKGADRADVEARLNTALERLNAARGSLEEQRRALEHQRQVLERQIEMLEKKIGHIEQQQDKIDSERDELEQSRHERDHPDSEESQEEEAASLPSDPESEA
jgi:hypothetical protein